MLCLTRVRALWLAPALTVAIGPPASCGDFVVVDVATSFGSPNYYDVDCSSLPAETLLGPDAQGSFIPKGIDRGPDGTLYSVSSNFSGGYTIHTIDESTWVRTAVHATSTGASFNDAGVGIAISPNGNSAWVIGLDWLTFQANHFEEVDLSTGTVTPHGQLPTQFNGVGSFVPVDLAFDASGELYAMMSGNAVGFLVRVDRTDLANSVALQITTSVTPIGNFNDVHMASDRGSGSMHVAYNLVGSTRIYSLDSQFGSQSLECSITEDVRFRVRFEKGPNPLV